MSFRRAAAMGAVPEANETPVIVSHNGLSRLGYGHQRVGLRGVCVWFEFE
jgi:hypothetical protein